MTPDAVKMKALVAEHLSVSDKIRALSDAGYSRSDIARFLGKRYQHVRNVLVGDEQVGRTGLVKPNADANAASHAEGKRRSIRVRVGPAGGIVIPEPFRDALGLKEGDVLFARLEDGEINLLTAQTAVRRAQAIFAPYRRPGVSVVDNFLADRRKMWGEEDPNG